MRIVAGQKGVWERGRRYILSSVGGRVEGALGLSRWVYPRAKLGYITFLKALLQAGGCIGKGR